jgi:hypothetical protein
MAKINTNVLKLINPRISPSVTPRISINITAMAPIINPIGK